MTLLSIGDRVEPGTYRLHSRFRRAVNYERSGRLVSVVDEAVGPGPLNIVIRALAGVWPPLAQECSADFQSAVSWICNPQDPATSPSAGRLKTCDTAAWKSALPGNRLRGGRTSAHGDGLCLEVGPRTILFAGRSYRFNSRHRYSSDLDLPKVDPRLFRRNLLTFGRLLRETAPARSLAFLLDETRLEHFRTGFERAFSGRIRRGVHQVLCGNLLKGVGVIRGCGVGLTPSGDDFVVGLLIALHLLGHLRVNGLQPVAEAVCRAAQGSNLFSNTALDLARRGLLFGGVKDLLLALASGSGSSLRRATQRLLAIGASSGADLGTGLFLTLRNAGGAVERWKAQVPCGRPVAGRPLPLGVRALACPGPQRHPKD